MEDNLKKVRTEIKKMKKCSCKSKKRKREDSSEESNNSWSVGLGSTGELEHVANVPNKTYKNEK